MTKHYDYLAIGGGSGGIASINRAAMYGRTCALIEANALGGTCVNVGCVPKKVMWHAAQIAEAIKLYGPDYGFDTTLNRFDWQRLIDSRSAYIERIHQSYQRGLGNNKVDVIQGFATFIDAHTVEVNGERISADHILIATGDGRRTRISRAQNMVSTPTASLPLTHCRSASPSLARATSRSRSPGCSTRWAPKPTCLSVSMRRCAASTV